jgi:hypothetical protein
MGRTASVVVAACVTVLGACTGDGDRSSTSSAAITTEPASTTGAIATSTSAAPSPTTRPAPPTTITEPQLERPVIDLAGCRQAWGRDAAAAPVEGAYVWSHSPGLPLQLIVPAGGGPAGRFAVAVRAFSGQRFDPSNANTSVGATPARAGFPTPRWGELTWRLPDGSEAYLRTSTMTQAELTALAVALVPRPAGAPIPAFDVSGEELSVLDEAVSPVDVGPIRESACELDGGGWLKATIVAGRALGHALFLTDRGGGAAVAVRALADGRILVVTGREDVSGRVGEALGHVREATDVEWQSLTSASPGGVAGGP